MRIDQVTATGAQSKKMASKGRYGDTEMAHVTPGEVVVPHSIQTPQVKTVLKQEFDRQGVPMQRYVVQASENSKNPETGKDEYFLKKLVKAAAPIVGGAIGGPAGAAIGGVVGGAIGGGGSVAGGSSGSAAPAAGGTPLAPPVQALVNSGGVAQPRIATVTSMLGNRDEMSDPVSSQLGQSIASQFDIPMEAVAPGVPRISRANSINAATGAPQFYDMFKPKNPKTGKQEFFDTPQNNAQQIAANIAAKRGLQISSFGDGNALAVLQSDPAAMNEFNSIVNSQPAGWASTPLGQSSPAPAANSPAPAPAQSAPAQSDRSYGWTGSADNVNDWVVENFYNLTPEQQQQAVEVLRTIPVTPGQGSRSVALQNDPSLNARLAQELRGRGFQIGTGGNVYTPTSAAPNAPAPYGANNNPAFINPAGSAAAGGNAGSANETITGFYSQTGRQEGWGGTGGNTRVMTASGKIYDVIQDSNTGQLSYKPADSLDGFKQVMQPGSLGVYNTPSNRLDFGNNTSRQSLSIGSSFGAPGNTENNRLSGVNTASTPNGKSFGNTGLTTSNNSGGGYVPQTSGPTDMTGNQTSPVSGSETPDWYSGITDQLSELENMINNSNTNTSGGSTGGNTDSGSGIENSGTTTNPNNNIATTSTLSPTRDNRFRSRTREGGLARSF